jgi:drug/metabolite transporter (DMT)-like permease
MRSEQAVVHAGDSPWGTRRGLLLLRGTLGYGSITCFFLACQMLPLADATTFTFLAPLVAALLSPLVLHERPGIATAFVIPLCLGGVLLITQPGFLFGAKAAPALSGVGLFFGLLQPLFSASAKV